MELKPLVIKGKTIQFPVFQGGMGIGVSLYTLSGSVAAEGGAGIISSALLHEVGMSKKIHKKTSPYQAVIDEIMHARNIANGGYVGMNIMVKLVRDFDESVRGSLDADVDAIICGAGLPLSLPKIQKPKDTALIPIVSSLRALELIMKKWERGGYRPDAVIVEGPLAGGHLGFDFNDIENPACSLEAIFLPIKDYAMSHGDFPVIVAGGIYAHLDIINWQKKGADGAQMGMRFAVTEESSANEMYKQAVMRCQKSDIVVLDAKYNPPGSPSKFSFRALKDSPVLTNQMERKPLCSRGALLQKDEHGFYTQCPAKDDCKNFFCICNCLAAVSEFAPDSKESPFQIWTVGANAYRVNKILSVHSLMNRLKGLEKDD